MAKAKTRGTRLTYKLIPELPDFDIYQREGSKFIHNGFPAICSDTDMQNSLLMVENNLLVNFYYSDVSHRFRNYGSVGFIINKDTVLCDADNEGTEHVDCKNKPSVSFACMSQLYKNEKEVVELLQKGILTLVDYTDDESKAIPAADLRKFNKWVGSNVSTRGACPLIPPKAGFTKVGDNWHRSGNCLFFDKKREESYLFGQDESMYFGVELASVCKTVDAAFKSLIPKEAKGADVKRQGEWFAVPCDEPSLEDTIARSEECMMLPKEDKKSADHTICSTDIRVGIDGIIRALRPVLRHSNGDHGDLACVGWVAFYKNTAIRSVSQDGVD